MRTDGHLLILDPDSGEQREVGRVTKSPDSYAEVTVHEDLLLVAQGREGVAVTL
jgi:hypothetical protein